MGGRRALADPSSISYWLAVRAARPAPPRRIDQNLLEVVHVPPWCRPRVYVPRVVRPSRECPITVPRTVVGAGAIPGQRFLVAIRPPGHLHAGAVVAVGEL